MATIYPVKTWNNAGHQKRGLHQRGKKDSRLPAAAETKKDLRRQQEQWASD